jgi:hypothetical protein
LATGARAISTRPSEAGIICPRTGIVKAEGPGIKICLNSCDLSMKKSAA